MQLLTQLIPRTLSLKPDAIECWTIEDWFSLMVLVIKGLLLGGLTSRLAMRVFT
jgi:hypothetical protein